MNENEIWLWLVGGLVPYHVKQVNLPSRERSLEVRALFWSLAVRRRSHGHYEWK
jgi:hypothetical protein